MKQFQYVNENELKVIHRLTTSPNEQQTNVEMNIKTQI